MTRTVPTAIATKLANGLSTLSRCLRLDLRDGTSIGITDRDRALTVNLGDGDLTYSARTGVLPSAVSLKLGFETDNFEVRGPIGDLVTQAAVLGGRYDRAVARLFDVDWQAPGNTAPLMRGHIAEARVEAGEFVFTVRSVADAFNQTIGVVLTPYCRYDFGDSRCGVDTTSYTFAGTVTGVTDEMTFQAMLSGSPTAAQARMGKVEWLTGDLAGTNPMEVFGLSGTTLTMWAPMAEPPAIGDTFNLKAGCSKLRASDDATIPTCFSYANVENFGGEPDLTGSDGYNKYPVPGSSA